MAKDLHIGALLDVYGPFLSEKQRVIAEHYYFDDLSLSEIAENENISRQAVRDLIRRVGETLVAYEKKCGYFDKFSALKTLCENENADIDEIKRIIYSL
ncbi:MAG: hypothetical protein IJJ40_05745 [Clostridia bacterium]|nr:hypothetical protein [Clostridia bacterium]